MIGLVWVVWWSGVLIILGAWVALGHRRLASLVAGVLTWAGVGWAAWALARVLALSPGWPVVLFAAFSALAVLALAEKQKAW